MVSSKYIDSELNQNYSSNEEQLSNLKRIDRSYILHEIEHVLHFERGILYTIKELSIRPGNTVRHFIFEDRSRLVKPVIFIIITSLIYSIINKVFHIEDGYVKFDEVKQSTTGYIFKWGQEHYGYANIIMSMFIAFWTKLFFRRYNYNYFEILILLCFIVGIAMLIYSVFGVFKGLTKIDLMQIGAMVGIVYSSWAVGQFFDKKRAMNYFKAFASCNCLGGPLEATA